MKCLGVALPEYVSTAGKKLNSFLFKILRLHSEHVWCYQNRCLFSGLQDSISLLNANPPEPIVLGISRFPAEDVTPPPMFPQYIRFHPNKRMAYLLLICYCWRSSLKWSYFVSSGAIGAATSNTREENDNDIAWMGYEVPGKHCWVPVAILGRNGRITMKEL
ncbi:hypothetical protein BDD12DRAFT_263339 [Trichophaea hybrida]|nr:hypothetical protein BDD12DRAFT_263339 [Trichophaea hybrida]